MSFKLNINNNNYQSYKQGLRLTSIFPLPRNKPAQRDGPPKSETTKAIYSAVVRTLVRNINADSPGSVTTA